MSIRAWFITWTALAFSLEISAMEWQRMYLTIENIDTARGGEIAVYVFLEDGFPIAHEKAIKNYRLDATRPVQSLAIEVPDSPFSIKVHHDEDGSRTVTKIWTGLIPSEGLAFSSDARLRLGHPSFSQASMIRPRDGKASIAIIYP